MVFQFGWTDADTSPTWLGFLVPPLSPVKVQTPRPKLSKPFFFLFRPPLRKSAVKIERSLTLKKDEVVVLSYFLFSHWFVPFSFLHPSYKNQCSWLCRFFSLNLHVNLFFLLFLNKDVKSCNKVTEFYFISKPASERAGALTVDVHHIDRCGHNHASSHYSHNVSGGRKKNGRLIVLRRKLRCRERKSWGGKKNADPHFCCSMQWDNNPRLNLTI